MIHTKQSPETESTGAQSAGALDPAVYRRRWVILGALCLSLLIIVMDNTILNVAIPSLIKDLGASNRQIQWVLDSYTLVFAGLLLTTGSLSDRFGRKGALQLGIALFMLGSVASALTTSADQLIFTRAFMGIGGALIMPSTLSILMNVFHNPVERARAIGVWAAFSGLGVAIGPIVGGALLERFSWHSVFWVNVPIGTFALIIGAMIIPTSKNPHKPALDPLGAVLSIAALAALLFAIIEGPSLGWASLKVGGAATFGAATLAAFILWERHTTHPMLDMSVFANARFTAASLTITMLFFALFGSLFLLTQYWQLVDGYSPLDAGIRLLPFAITMMIVAPLSSKVVEHHGTKRVVLGGLLTMAVGTALLSTIKVATPYITVISYYVLMAVGMGMTMAPATESVMGSLPKERAGVGSAINDTTRQVGGAMGVAVIGSIVQSLYATRIASAASGFSLDATAVGQAKLSLGAAQQIGATLGTSSGEFVAEANEAFVYALSWGLRAGVVVILFAAAFAWRQLPARAPEEQAPITTIGGDTNLGQVATAAVATARR